MIVIHKLDLGMLMTEAEVEAKIQAALEQGATSLEFYAVELTAVPESVGRLTQLQKLILDLNLLQTLPDSVGSLTQLEVLDLNGNDLHTLPATIGNLSRLQELRAGVNKLQELPESIGKLTKLRRLDLWGNQLTGLPENLRDLTQLEWLNLSDNPHLATLPYGLKVERLDVSGCTRLSSLPDNLDVTHWIDIADTAITDLPACAKGAEIRWHGVPIDERIAFHPESITHEEVLAEPNTERRRVLLERMGYERFMREAQPEVLDSEPDAGAQ